MGASTASNALIFRGNSEGTARSEDDTDSSNDRPANKMASEPLKPVLSKWVPTFKLSQNEHELSAEEKLNLTREKTGRKVRSLLNKLTPEVFDHTLLELVQILDDSKAENDAYTLKQVFDGILTRACDEPFFSTLYSKLCLSLIEKTPDTISDVTSCAGSGAHGSNLARRVLISKCQENYKKFRAVPSSVTSCTKVPEMMSDEYYEVKRNRRMQVGLHKFIGNAYVLELLSEAVILLCLHEHIRDLELQSEEYVENLVVLVKTVGPRLEKSKPHAAALDNVLSSMAKLVATPISSRLRFMLMDLADFRKSDWKPQEPRAPLVQKRKQRQLTNLRWKSRISSPGAVTKDASALRGPKSNGRMCGVEQRNVTVATKLENENMETKVQVSHVATKKPTEEPVENSQMEKPSAGHKALDIAAKSIGTTTCTDKQTANYVPDDVVSKNRTPRTVKLSLFGGQDQPEPMIVKETRTLSLYMFAGA